MCASSCRGRGKPWAAPTTGGVHAEDKRLAQLAGLCLAIADSLCLRSARSDSRAPGPQLQCRAVPGLSPARLHPRLLCTLLAADWLRHEGPRDAPQSSGLASAAPPRTAGLSRALGRCGPFSPATELRPFLLCPLARGRRRGCWSAVGRPRDCQPHQEAVSGPRESSGRGLSCRSSPPFQRESCQRRVAGARSAFAKGNVPNKGCWCLCPAGVAVLLPALPFSAAKGQEGPCSPLLPGVSGQNGPGGLLPPASHNRPCDCKSGVSARARGMGAAGSWGSGSWRGLAGVCVVPVPLSSWGVQWRPHVTKGFVVLVATACTSVVAGKAALMGKALVNTSQGTRL